MLDLKQYELLVFDCDGTLYLVDSLELLPWTKEMIAIVRAAGIPWVIASNQGSWACSETNWKTAEKYKKPAEILERFDRIQHELMPDEIYLSFAFYNKHSDTWALPKSLPYNDERGFWWWRKPWPGMIWKAMDGFGIGKNGRVLIVGDSEDDRGAAESSERDFMNIDDFVKALGLKGEVL